MVKRRITIEEITKIEGHANLTIEIEDNKVNNIVFGIHEGSRYFEAFMDGKEYKYLPELSGRICGICTVAHEIASVKAIENALDVDVPNEVIDIRRLMLISSHIQSHVLHLYFLALPDYTGVESVFELAGKDLDIVKKAFKIKEATNYMTALIGGRAVQPCTVTVGGLTKKITKETLENYKKKMKEIYPLLVETAELFLSLEYPNFERENEYAALYDGKNIPLYDGNIKSSSREFECSSYAEHIEEFVVDYSSAKHSTLDGVDYMVGALARLNLNPYLRDEARELGKMYNVTFPSDRIAWINIAQALENVHYALEALDLIDDIKEYYPHKSQISCVSGEGIGAIEAPRGLLIHHYKIKNKRCVYSNIITPTAMNTENIERVLWEYIPQLIDESNEIIKQEAEKIIRAYDPCISCSVHVINMKKQ